MLTFFEFAHKRHTMYLRRQREELWPWSDDPVLNKYRFTNVYRELDATTVWFRRWVRDPMREDPYVVLATTLFRWLNRVKTGEAVFRQTVAPDAKTPWEMFAFGSDLIDDRVDEMIRSVRSYCGPGPYVTGAYIIKTPNGRDKLRGVLECVQDFMCIRKELPGHGDCSWHEVAEICLQKRGEISLEMVWKWLRAYPYMGDFMAYEVITDLRHTAILDQAPDIMLWANPGPGAMRGLDRIHGRYLESQGTTKIQYILEMRELLVESQSGSWPNDEEYPPLEMREIEHTLCEYDKYIRTTNGEGRPRGVFRAV